MTERVAPGALPFCPNPGCRFHRQDRDRWAYVKAGFFNRSCEPHRIQRYRCSHCRRYFSDQTFRTTYWLKQPGLLPLIFHRLLSCSGFRQIAREFDVSPSTIACQTARLGRHCILFHEKHRPKGAVSESLALDSFITFEYSQYWPCAFHVAAGRTSHYFYGFTESELRRSGTMTPAQKERRKALEEQHGRPDPRAVERDVGQLLATLAPKAQALELHTDKNPDYPRALRHVAHLSIEHKSISSRAARTSRNPLFEINLLDLLIRHSGANHKRETIAFSKRRQAAVERLALFLVWRNYVKHFSERKRAGTPAMKLGLLERPLRMEEVLGARLFPSQCRLSRRWSAYYRGDILTRQIPKGRAHRLKYAA